MSRILPYYKWFPRDFRASTKVMSLSWEEKGVYRELLDIQWDENGIPDDLAECMRLVRGAKKKCVERVISLFFVPHPTLSGLLINRKLHALRENTEEVSKTKANAGKRSGESRRETPAKDEHMFDSARTHVPVLLNEKATTRTRDSQKLELEEEYTPLPPDSGTPASTEGEGEGISQAEAEARHHREYCRKEAKGLPKAFLDDGAFRDAWCDWVAHLKARHHKGFNPPFTTVSRHKEQIRMHSVADATWALKEGIRRNLPFPADPAKRAAGSSSGSVDLMSAAAPLKNPIPTDYYDPLEVCGLQSPPPERQRRRAEPSA